jgi:hypothetical protein
MAESNDKLAEGGDAPPKKGKRKLLVGGGVTALVATAFVAALMAVPKKSGERALHGPFVAPLTPEKVQVNLAGAKNFLILDLNIVYDAYEETYFLARAEDPLMNAEIKDALVGLTSAKTREDVADSVNRPVLMEELRAAVDPLLFPVHVGETAVPTRADPTSGVGPGMSAHDSTFRGEHDLHLLKVDAVERSLQIDDGPVIGFEGHETDLSVTTADDSVLYLDVSGLKDGFQGEVRVGVMGRVRRILWNEVLIQ